MPETANPCLVIAGARLKGQECSLPYSAQPCGVQVIELDKMNRVTQGPDNDVVLPRCRAGEQLRHRGLDLFKRLPGSESAFCAVNVDMGQVEMRRANTGERIKHP